MRGCVLELKEAPQQPGQIAFSYAPSLEPLTGTIEVWINAKKFPTVSNEITQEADIVWKESFDGGSATAYGLRLRGDGSVYSLYMHSINRPSSPPDTIRIGQWHHLAITWDMAEIGLYVDGALIDKMSVIHQPGIGVSLGTLNFKTSNVVRVGHDSCCVNDVLLERFTGRIDDLRFYSKVLSDQQIEMHYKKTAASLPENPAPSQIWMEPKSGLEFVFVPAGEFIMGSTPQQIEEAIDFCESYHKDTTTDPCGEKHFNAELWPSDAPKVSTNGYWIGKTEVTNAQYVLCKTCTPPQNLNWVKPEYAEHPVTSLTWQQAKDYATWVGGRLPTEAEWEKAARGTDGRIYPWGDNWNDGWSNVCDKQCNLVYPETSWAVVGFDDGHAGTAPVGIFEKDKSPYGAFDMTGNVWEWTSTLYTAITLISRMMAGKINKPMGLA